MCSPQGDSENAEFPWRILSRSRLEEEMAVLEAVREGAHSMELLQTRTRLPWSVLSRTTGFLLGAGLMTVADDNHTVKLSLREKGAELIKRYKGIVERIEAVRAVVQVGPG